MDIFRSPISFVKALFVTLFAFLTLIIVSIHQITHLQTKTKSNTKQYFYQVITSAFHTSGNSSTSLRLLNFIFQAVDTSFRHRAYVTYLVVEIPHVAIGQSDLKPEVHAIISVTGFIALI